MWRTLLLLAPTLLSLACLGLLLCHVRVPQLMQVAFVLLICISIPKLVFVLTALTGKALGLALPAAETPTVRIGMWLAVLTAAIQIYGSVWGWQRLQVKRQHLYLQGLPTAFDGYRVVQLSDLHLGTYAGDTAFMARLVDSVNSLRPDLIVFTGDMVNTSATETVPYVQVLRRLQATDGVLSVLGNQDYMTDQPGLSPTGQRAELQTLLRAQQLMGWQVLNNAHQAIVRQGDTLYVAGVENVGKPPFPTRGNLSKALRGIPPQACTLLLSHDPWHWRHGVVGNRPQPVLTLSGHTHALQMQIGSFSPARWLMPEWGGLYSEGTQQLYVSTGIGGSVPYRLGAWPQIELFTLHPAKH